MALHIEKASAVPPGGVVCDRRLYLAADRERVVEANDPAAAFLFATPGMPLGAADLARHQLEFKDEKIVLAPSQAPDEGTAQDTPDDDKPSRARRRAT